jgi:hypothetical protein
MLLLTNNDSGSDDTALDLNVQSGEPPMTVNSTTRVTNLNSDRLDGQNASAFASYERTVIVSPAGTNAQNGQALLDALSPIKDSSASKPYLLYLEPATYDLVIRGGLSEAEASRYFASRRWAREFAYSAFFANPRTLPRPC